MDTNDILVAGTGSLARVVCESLAVLGQPGLAVAVLSATPGRAERISYLAGARAALAGTGVRFRPITTGEYSTAAFAAALDEVRPRLVLNCASLHSPWEAARMPSAWTRLVARAGFGFSLPLQAAIAVELARAMARRCPEALLVNACYPDAVNPVLRALGLPVLCGIGNIGLLSASLRAELRTRREDELRAVGHHWHLHVPDDDHDELLAWLNGEPVVAGPPLTAQRAMPRVELNAVTGLSAAVLLLDLLADREVVANLPGPAGLPGGYPVRIAGGTVRLDLPPSLDRAAAVARNQHWAELDGVRVDEDGTVRFSAEPAVLAEAGLAALARPVRAEAIPEVSRVLVRVRAELRARTVEPVG